MFMGYWNDCDDVSPELIYLYKVALEMFSVLQMSSIVLFLSLYNATAI
jgi:hypothetical protein